MCKVYRLTNMENGNKTMRDRFLKMHRSAASRMLLFSVSIVFCCCGTAPKTAPVDEVRQALTTLCDSIDATIGIAVSYPDGDTLTLAGDTPFALLSVVKFPQALAICQHLARTGCTLADTLHVTADDLPAGTWSPLRDEQPEGGPLTLGELMHWSLVMSDNNACDILFHRVLSVTATDTVIHAMGIADCHIQSDEQAMRADPQRCYHNAATPQATVQLLQYLYDHHDEPLLSMVWNDMSLCQTGQQRIPAGVGDSIRVVHKTGTGPVIDGRLLALNDVGILLLPDGTHLELAVFVQDAALTPDQAEALIARITRIILQKG